MPVSSNLLTVGLIAGDAVEQQMPNTLLGDFLDAGMTCLKPFL